MSNPNSPTISKIFSLAGKTVLVIDAGKGIGRAWAGYSHCELLLRVETVNSFATWMPGLGKSLLEKDFNKKILKKPVGVDHDICSTWKQRRDIFF